MSKLRKIKVSPFSPKTYGPKIFGVRNFDSFCAAWSLGRTWRNSLANMLRFAGDRVEHAAGFTVTIEGPPGTDWEQGIRALEFGLGEANRRFNEGPGTGKSVEEFFRPWQSTGVP